MENIQNKPSDMPSQPRLDISKEMEIIASEEKFIDAGTSKLLSDLGEIAEQLERGKDIDLAIALMIKVHIDQKDRPQEPYLNHTSNVSLRLSKEFGVTDPDIIIAGLLHDSIEDQTGKLSDLSIPDTTTTERENAIKYIRDSFGPHVEHLVMSLSNPETPKELDSRKKNELYKQHVSDIIKDPEVALIKLADFSENALRLDEVDDMGRRLRLSKKYGPVVQLFIERLGGKDIPLEEERKIELISSLEDSLKDIESYISENQ